MSPARLAELGLHGDPLVQQAAKAFLGFLERLHAVFELLLEVAIAVALVLLVIGSPAPVDWWFNTLGVVLLYAATVMTLWSMLDYLRLAWPDLVDS